MTAPRTLRESHEAIESIRKEVQSILGVAALDVADIYGDRTLDDVFMREASAEEKARHGSHVENPIAYRFAEQLVSRLLYTPELVLDWVESAPVTSEKN